MTANANSEVVRPRRRQRRLVASGCWASLGAVFLVWITLLPRIVPDLGIDRGIFVSVAERLLAGDVLYRDVWDNKDPLFYYGIAATRLVTPFADLLAEFFLVACSAIAVLVIGRWSGLDRHASWFVAFGVAPIIITGGFYLPGYTHLPGIALTLWILASGASRLYAVAGALLGILLFTKIIMLPIAFLMLLGVVIVRREWRAVLSAAAGFVLAAGGVAALLQVRGELQPYLHSLLLNATYSQGSLVEGRGGSFIRHLIKMASFQTLSVGVLIFLAVAWMLWLHRRNGTVLGADKRNLILWASVSSSMLGAVVVLGFTGLWKHHAQVMYVAAILACIGIVHRLQPVFNVRSPAAVAAFLCLALCFSGQATPVAYPQAIASSITALPESLPRLGSIPPEAQAVLSLGSRGTYARVGSNDDLGHAKGLAGWDLVCPRFHQYPFDSRQSLRDNLACIPSAQVIIVSASAAPISGNADWNEYITGVEATLRDQHICNPWGQTRVCVRKNL